MPPNATTEYPPSETNETEPHAEQTGVLSEDDAETIDGGLAKDLVSLKQAESRPLELLWPNTIAFTLLHLGALYGAWLCIISTKWVTIAYVVVLYFLSILGITAGVHRLWAHRAYKAKWPLQFILIILNTLGGMHSAMQWAKVHRVHHKFSDTDADPHNATRGFFFSHIGWVMVKKDREYRAKVDTIDLSDLRANPFVRFQEKYYAILLPLICFILPTLVPIYFWNETFIDSIFVVSLLRYTLFVNGTFTINSFAHKYGHRPYDKNISPSETSPFATITLGESWHNYHHAFPWDYKAAELGNYRLNLTTGFIDLCAKIGWAYDLKTVSQDIIKKRSQRTGDGTHHLWGWGDEDQAKEEIDNAVILNKKSE